MAIMYSIDGQCLNVPLIVMLKEKHKKLVEKTFSLKAWVRSM